ncbi:hypothetical protein KP509_36G048900 [Ceratopteris richardii]|uniref:Uncharacterized protein n=1 Tax=Ceratopteris richardii TaxID=49495 RepID=A0A8T2QCP3_CERRI|nr:hypothetical protein KP509_36G048900 [Ceratopteris richardii]
MKDTERELKLNEEEEGKEEQILWHRRSYASPASRKLATVVSDGEEEDVPIKEDFCARKIRSCLASSRILPEEISPRGLASEPTGRRRLFKFSEKSGSNKDTSDLKDISNGGETVQEDETLDALFVRPLRKRLRCSYSSSSAEARSTVETDSESTSTRRRLPKSEDPTTATSTLIQHAAPKPEKEGMNSSLSLSNRRGSNNEIVPLPIQPNARLATDIKASKLVKDTLRLFNSYYLRFVQEEEARCRKEEGKERAKKSKEPKKSRRPDLKAISQMRIDNKLGHNGKVLGPVPGINVGDQFFSRCEMVAVGLHCHWLGGIDTIPVSFKQKLNISKLPVASSIVLSGNYEDDIDNSEDVIYTGSGGNDLLGNKRQIANQVLKRGNLALKNNMEQGIAVRLVRGHKTKKSYTGKVYTYDGLYMVTDFWAEEGISGFTVYKFRLKRVEGQPVLTTNQVHFVSGHVIPSSIIELKGLVCMDISNGLEPFPIPATNVHNPPLAPRDFEYITEIKVQKKVKKTIPAKGCKCNGACNDPCKCSCAVRNNKRFPYVAQNGGRLVEPMDVVYECGPACGCDQTCPNRVTQKGMQYRLEVFRTINKGWGVRTWDTIPAGAPVCQYFGVLMRTEDADAICDNEFIFELDCLQTIKEIGGRQMSAQWTGDLRRLVSNGDKVGLDKECLMKVPEQPEYCIDAGSCGSVSRLINHSCEPNLFVQCVLNDHHDLSQPRIWFFAAETIHPLQELSYDYGYALDSVVKNGKVKVLPCYCGALTCRKRLH